MHKARPGGRAKPGSLGDWLHRLTGLIPIGSPARFRALLKFAGVTTPDALAPVMFILVCHWEFLGPF